MWELRGLDKRAGTAIAEGFWSLLALGDSSSAPP